MTTATAHRVDGIERHSDGETKLICALARALENFGHFLLQKYFRRALMRQDGLCHTVPSSCHREDRRFRRALLAPCLPNAVLVRLGRCAMLRLRFAAVAAFLMLRRAAVRCLAVAISAP